MNSRARLLPFLTAAMLFTASRVHAHAISAEATLIDGKVQIEAYFDDDTPARDAKVQVTDGGKVIAQGRTDETGLWSFPAPAAGKYRLVVDAGAGHIASSWLTIPSDSAEKKQVSDGDSRDEFTRMPWDRLAIGIAAIFAIGIVLPWLMKRTRSK